MGIMWWGMNAFKRRNKIRHAQSFVRSRSCISDDAEDDKCGSECARKRRDYDLLCFSPVSLLLCCREWLIQKRSQKQHHFFLESFVCECVTYGRVAEKLCDFNSVLVCISINERHRGPRRVERRHSVLLLIFFRLKRFIRLFSPEFHLICGVNILFFLVQLKCSERHEITVLNDWKSERWISRGSFFWLWLRSFWSIKWPQQLKKVCTPIDRIEMHANIRSVTKLPISVKDSPLWFYYCRWNCRIHRSHLGFGWCRSTGTSATIWLRHKISWNFAYRRLSAEPSHCFLVTYTAHFLVRSFPFVIARVAHTTKQEFSCDCLFCMHWYWFAGSTNIWTILFTIKMF